MTQSSRTQLSLVRETTAGTTPTTPRMRLVRMTGESLTFTPTYVDPEEIRADRMNADPILVMKDAGGGVNFELTYPDDNSPLSEIIRSAMFATWTNTNQRDNDGTADSVITDVTAATGVITVTTGTAFVVGQLVQLSGFTAAGNNIVARITTGSATVPAVGAGLLTNDTAPAAAARMKVVGFAGVAADITATATGLGSTTLNFTTLGLSVGQWVKIGGTAAGDKFATAALNGWARITAIAATALTLDNLPSGWTTDAGTGKTIKVWFGDTIKNGVTQTSMSIEKGFLGQTTPVYIPYTGMVVGTLQITAASRQKVTGSAAFTGMGGSEGTVALDASPDAATTGRVMAGNANVASINEAGSALTSPNWAQEFSFTIANALRTVDDVTQQSPQGVREGDNMVTGNVRTYFGNDVLLAKYYAGTITNLNCRIAKDSQAIIFGFPRVTYRSDGSPNATAKATDVFLPLGFQASIDTVTNSQVIIDRLPYYE